MAQHVFQKWFETQLLPNMNHNSTIVTLLQCNAPYYTVELTKTSSRKPLSPGWNSTVVNTDSSLTQGALLALTKENKPPEKYILDELAKSHGHEAVSYTHLDVYKRQV